MVKTYQNERSGYSDRELVVPDDLRELEVPEYRLVLFTESLVQTRQEDREGFAG